MIAELTCAWLSLACPESVVVLVSLPERRVVYPRYCLALPDDETGEKIILSNEYDETTYKVARSF